MPYFISVKNKKGNYQVFSVPKEIYIYILQLENYILNPKKSKLKEVYNFGLLKIEEEGE